MAEVKWLGVADPIAQVDTIVIFTFDAATTYTVTINTDIVEVVGITDADTTAAALHAALVASTNPYFANITWTILTGEGADTITATASSPGNPHTFSTSVSGGTGAITGPNSITASSGPNDWDVARNWDTGTVPVSTDDVIIENGSTPITHGLDQSAVTLDSLTIKLSYTGRIGLKEKDFAQSSDGSTFTALKEEFKDQYLQIGATLLSVGENFTSRPENGSNLVKIDLGSVLSTITIHETGTSSFEPVFPAIQLLGTNASNVMTVRSARAGVGVAVHGFEVSTMLSIDVGSDMSAGGVTLGEGVTLGSFSQQSGTHFINAAGTVTNLTLRGGTITTEGDYTVTLVEISDGTRFFANHIKTAGNAISTLTMTGSCIIDTTKNSVDRTFNTVFLEIGGQIKTNESFLTINNLNRPDDVSTLIVE